MADGTQKGLKSWRILRLADVTDLGCSINWLRVPMADGGILFYILPIETRFKCD